MNKAKSKITPNTESWKSDKHLNMFSNQINILDFYLMHVLYPLKGIVNTVTKRNMYNFFRISESVSFFFFLLLFLPQNRGGGLSKQKRNWKLAFFCSKNVHIFLKIFITSSTFYSSLLYLHCLYNLLINVPLPSLTTVTLCLWIDNNYLHAYFNELPSPTQHSFYAWLTWRNHRHEGVLKWQKVSENITHVEEEKKVLLGQKSSPSFTIFSKWKKKIISLQFGFTCILPVYTVTTHTHF